MERLVLSPGGKVNQSNNAAWGPVVHCCYFITTPIVRQAHDTSTWALEENEMTRADGNEWLGVDFFLNE